MFRIILCLCMISSSLVSRAQTLSWKETCESDTISFTVYSPHYGSSYTARGFKCYKPGGLGMRVEFGAGKNYYSRATSGSLGKNLGVLLGASLAYRQWSLAYKFKITTLDFKKDLLLNGDTLRSGMISAKSNYCLAYSFNFKYNISLEPYLGYSKARFIAYNDSTNRFNIPVCEGLIAGVTLNKYFRMKDYQYLCAFLSLGCSFTNFRNSQPDLGAGFAELSFGLAWKGFLNRDYNKELKEQ